MFLAQSLTDANFQGDIFPSNICPGDIWLYQQYFSNYCPNIDQFFWRVLFLYWPKFSWHQIFLGIAFFAQHFSGPRIFLPQKFFNPKIFWSINFLAPKFFWTSKFFQTPNLMSFQAEHFWLQSCLHCCLRSPFTFSYWKKFKELHTNAAQTGNSIITVCVSGN